MFGFLSAACADEHSRGCQNGQNVTDWIWFIFHWFLGLFAPEDAYFLRKVGFQPSG
jgi:hypothetical protein